MESFTIKNLDAILSDGQQQTLAEKLREVAASGYGRVTIVINKGHPSFIETCIDERLEPAPFVQ